MNPDVLLLVFLVLLPPPHPRPSAWECEIPWSVGSFIGGGVVRSS